MHGAPQTMCVSLPRMALPTRPLMFCAIETRRGSTCVSARASSLRAGTSRCAVTSVSMASLRLQQVVACEQRARPARRPRSAGLAASDAWRPRASRALRRARRLDRHRLLRRRRDRGLLALPLGGRRSCPTSASCPPRTSSGDRGRAREDHPDGQRARPRPASWEAAWQPRQGGGARCWPTEIAARRGIGARGRARRRRGRTAGSMRSRRRLRRRKMAPGKANVAVARELGRLRLGPRGLRGLRGADPRGGRAPAGDGGEPRDKLCAGPRAMRGPRRRAPRAG